MPRSLLNVLVHYSALHTTLPSSCTYTHVRARVCVDRTAISAHTMSERLYILRSFTYSNNQMKYEKLLSLSPPLPPFVRLSFSRLSFIRHSESMEFVHSSNGIYISHMCAIVCVIVEYARRATANDSICMNFVIKMLFFFSFFFFASLWSNGWIIQCERTNARHGRLVTMCERMRMALLYVLGSDCGVHIYSKSFRPVFRCRHKAELPLRAAMNVHLALI